MQTKLTAALVRRVTEAEPPAKDKSYFDTVIPRLALRTKPPRRPGGRWAALYFVRYTAPGGIERRIKIGDPRTMSAWTPRASPQRRCSRGSIRRRSGGRLRRRPRCLDRP